MKKELLQSVKKTVVFLGSIQDGNINLSATGFLVQVKEISHLVTAKHVVTDRDGEIKDDSLMAFVNKQDGDVTAKSISNMKSQLNVNWMFHEDDGVDIAMLPFALQEDFDIKVIPENLFLSLSDINELHETFFLSYQPGVERESKVSPVIRSGTVSRINEDGSFYIDGSAFPGNSGSPVFLKPSPIKFNSKGISIGGDDIGGKFIGIIGSYLPYREEAISKQTGKTRVVFEENTGLSKVWSIDCITDVMNTSNFNKQVERLSVESED